MSLRQKSRTVLHSQLQETVSGLCLLRLPEVMFYRGPAPLEEDKEFGEGNGPIIPKELDVVKNRVDCEVAFIQDFNE